MKPDYFFQLKNFLPATIAEEFRLRSRALFLFPQDGISSDVIMKSVAEEILKPTPHANDLEIQRNPNGKPFFPHFPDFKFNLSHSGDWVLFGLAQGMDIGVDLEMDRPIQDTTLWSEQILGPKERDEFQKKSLSEQPSLLLRSWTLKEAILKCAGGTFFGDALKIQISADSLKLIDLPEAYGKIANWDICHFDFDLQGRKAHCAHATRSLSAE